MRHWLVDEWSIDGLTAYIECEEIYDWAKYKKMKAERVLISDIGHVPYGDIDQEGNRYKNADITLPCLVVEGMENPHNKPYRMIDGRHRLLKSANNNIMEIVAYVLDRSQAVKFITYI